MQKPFSPGLALYAVVWALKSKAYIAVDLLQYAKITLTF